MSVPDTNHIELGDSSTIKTGSRYFPRGTMNPEECTRSSSGHGDDVESTNEPHSLAGEKLEEVPSGPKPLPPKGLNPYTTRQLRKRHVEPWLVFSILAIVGTILTATLVHNGGAAVQKGCTAIDGSEAEDLFRINLVVINGLTFVRAKFIDLLWDTAIGQGGRFVHGLILHQLVSRALTLLLERSALPFSFFLGVKFSTVSIESLWCCIRILYSRAPVRTSILVAGLFLAIGYVLAFPTIWSAATGYEADVVPAYDILGIGAFVPKDSDRLKTCWSVSDLNRVGPGLNNPILGPKFSQAYGGWENIGDKKEFQRLKMRTVSPAVETSEAFTNLYAYAIAKETFFRRHDRDSERELTQLNQTSGADTWYDNNCYNNGIETGTGYNFTAECKSKQLYTSVHGWQYAGLGQKEKENLSPDTRDEENPKDESRAEPNNSDYVPYNTSFLLDTEIIAEEHLVPYNSTIWWNGTRVPLNAPFLDFGANCQWFKGSLGLCLCLDGKVISKDFRTSDQICLNDTGYIWGFSGTVLLLALALEAAWLLLCSLMWCAVLAKSQLVKLHRPGAGVIRSVLDIAGAIDLSIGTDTGAYAEDELRKKLEKCPPIGFEVDDSDGAGYERIRLRPVRHGVRTRRNIRVNKHTLYG
ncbi:hypothetical protein ANO14919_099620 [Xylariales sp. No.14919]|nr:hypothetical protein ANO14919_099620 [Xylariales sp. No.14919]